MTEKFPSRVEKPLRIRRVLQKGVCKYCDAVRHEQFAPYHDASDRCESGKHPHCTCDVCF